jgi:hypothetical protein
MYFKTVLIWIIFNPNNDFLVPLCLYLRQVDLCNLSLLYVESKRVIHETQIICKSLTKRQIQCLNNISSHGFEFAMPYRALPGFVNDPFTLLNFIILSITIG